MVLFLFDDQILAERRHRRKLVPDRAHIGALALEIIRDRAAQRRVGDVMAGKRGDRKVAARELVLALRARFDAREAMLNGVIDRLVITELEMQERMVLDRAPV